MFKNSAIAHCRRLIVIVVAMFMLLTAIASYLLPIRHSGDVTTDRIAGIPWIDNPVPPNNGSGR